MSNNQTESEAWRAIPNSYIDKAFDGTRNFMNAYGIKPNGFAEAGKLRDAFKQRAWETGEYQKFLREREAGNACAESAEGPGGVVGGGTQQGGWNDGDDVTDGYTTGIIQYEEESDEDDATNDNTTGIIQHEEGRNGDVATDNFTTGIIQYEEESHGNDATDIYTSEIMQYDGDDDCSNDGHGNADGGDDFDDSNVDGYFDDAGSGDDGSDGYSWDNSDEDDDDEEDGYDNGW
ncbi:hypothetical protein HDV00_002531 [Rhizophlyctis rosea]|nr:hypothetical protein HDV00_002531 [Rhizophlyctis rosea]